MTAKFVDGVAVKVDEPTVSPISDKSGKTVVWNQIRTLTLADGREVYGCVHCDYTSANRNSIRPHLQKHVKRAKAMPAAVAPDVSLGDLLAKAAAHDGVAADRDQWKRRALAAEGSLRTLRKALGVTA